MSEGSGNWDESVLKKYQMSILEQRLADRIVNEVIETASSVPRTMNQTHQWLLWGAQNDLRGRIPADVSPGFTEYCLAELKKRHDKSFSTHYFERPAKKANRARTEVSDELTTKQYKVSSDYENRLNDLGDGELHFTLKSSSDVSHQQEVSLAITLSDGRVVGNIADILREKIAQLNMFESITEDNQKKIVTAINAEIKRILISLHRDKG
jgi:hypothetical protein